MSAALTKAAMIVAPNDMKDGVLVTVNEFGCLKFTAETTHRADPLPDSWKGRWVVIYAHGGTIDVAFSASSAAEVDRAVAPTNSGASTKVGTRVPSGQEKHRLLPRSRGTLYFARESDTAGAAAILELSDREV